MRSSSLRRLLFRPAMWVSGVLILAALACVGFAPGALATQGSGTPAVSSLQPPVEVPGLREFSGRLIVRPFTYQETLARGADRSEAARRVADAQREVLRFNVLHYVPQTNDYVVCVPAGQTEGQVIDRLMASGNFTYAEPDWILYPLACPDDPQFSSQWHHQQNRMQSCDGWTIHTGNPSVSVGICDTGVLTTHEDLLLHRLEGYNAVDRLWESQGGQIGPVHPHGTNTTGCAAANGNNGVGVSGVGWNLSHRMLRVSNSSGGSASLSDLQHAARTAVENGDRVASVSYSGADTSSNLTTATYIKSIGGLLCWAAGNDGRYLSFGNRDNDDLIVVGATDESDASAWFSAYGPFVDLVAPGVNVLTTDAAGNSSYSAVSGTSFSTPLTAGMCALIWSADPTLTPNQVESLLKQATDDLGAAGVDDTFGYGRINTFLAMSLAGGGGGGGQPPVADFSGSPTSGTAPLTVNFSDLSTGSPTSWAWDFGDGGTSTQQNPAYVYNTAGTYTVSMTATNANGSDILVRTGYISVSAPGQAPVADFSGTPTSGTAPLTVNFSDLSTGSPTSWAWDFGDGGTSTQQNPAYVYNTAGSYTVSMTATNANGSDTLVRTGYISVSAGSPYTGEGFILSKNADLSTDDRTFVRTDTIYMIVWSDQVDYTNMRKAEWELRDNNKNKVKQSLTNNGDGTFTASFSLSGLPSSATSWRWRGKLEDNSRTKYQPQTNITVTAGGGGTPPVADFSGTPTSGTAPLTVSFSDLSTGAPTSWSWDFGDGATSSQQNPGHTYNAAGSFTVTLAVSNVDGSDTMVKTNYITVNSGGQPPVADFSGTPTSGTAPLTVAFSDLSTGGPTSWAWDFGDGGTSTQQNPGHTYNAAGSYTVTLTAGNANGSNTMVKTGYITVSGGGGPGGEGFILSKNPDFSTNDTVFTRADVIYMKVWSDRVDYTNMRKAEWELRDNNKNKVKQSLTNNGDGTFTASFSLNGLPSNATSWRWRGKLEDNTRTKYRPQTNITVNP